MISLEPLALARIREILAEEDQPGLVLRVFVQGGGCSGLQYGFRLEDQQDEDDIVLDHDDVRLVVDPMSLQYLQEARINYKENDVGASFVIINPNATTTCGCGSSFSV